jgi:hypothetical protein
MPSLNIGSSAPDKPVRAEKKKRDLGPPSCAFTIQEFCDAHRISRSQFYRLREKGLGPKEKSVLGKIIITAESAAAWRRRPVASGMKRGAGSG